MKSTVVLAMVLGLVSAAGAWANDSVATSKSFRVSCDTTSSVHAYVSVRGTLTVNDNAGTTDNARGSLRVSFSGADMYYVDVVGQYVEQGNMQFMTLSPVSTTSDIQDMYIDFNDRGTIDNSYTNTFDGIYKMACRID